MPSSEIRRKTLVQNVLSRSISNVSKPIHAQTLAEAFPYATPQMLDTLAEQTKTLVSHYANVSNIFLLYLFQYVSCPWIQADSPPFFILRRFTPLRNQGRWEELAQSTAFEELCNQFDDLERLAMQRMQAGDKPVM